MYFETLNTVTQLIILARAGSKGRNQPKNNNGHPLEFLIK